VKRRLAVYAGASRRQQFSPACAAHAWLGPASVVLYDCRRCISRPTPGTGFRESGFSKERRLEPQITVGLLTDQSGFPPMVWAFEGSKAQTRPGAR